MFSSTAQLNGAVVHDHVVRGDGGERVGLPAAALRLAVGAGAHADVADDDVVRAHVEPAADERDAGRRRRLPRDREEGLADLEFGAAEVDHAADLEDDDRGPFASTAAANEPGPLAFRLVTRRMRPPRPPGVCAAQPTAPGKASGLSPGSVRGAPAARRPAADAQATSARSGIQSARMA
jgi:hypothetical protein